jgi:sugar phosphate isomerase/epimerase
MISGPRPVESRNILEPNMAATRSLSRRGFLAAGPAAVTVAGLAPRAIAQQPGSAGDPWLGLKIGIATYTFSRLPLDSAIAGVVRVGINYASIKDAHLPLKSTADQRREVAKRFRDAGITPLSCGVVTMNDSEADIRNVFEYARDAGVPTIVCSPRPASLPTLDRMVKEFNIRLAIHNHGPEDKTWPSPMDAWRAVQPFDERIGLCIDVGHTARTGLDPTKAIRDCAARLYDLHIKDIASKEGKSRPVEVGRGVLDIRAMLRALLDIGYGYHVGLEYEKDLNDPIPGAAESIGYIRGTLAGMR